MRVARGDVLWQERRRGLSLVRERAQRRERFGGLNLDWQVNDRLNLNFDTHTSESHSQPDGELNDLLSSAPQFSLAATGLAE